MNVSFTYLVLFFSSLVCAFLAFYTFALKKSSINKVYKFSLASSAFFLLGFLFADNPLRSEWVSICQGREALLSGLDPYVLKNLLQTSPNWRSFELNPLFSFFNFGFCWLSNPWLWSVFSLLLIFFIWASIHAAKLLPMPKNNEDRLRIISMLVLGFSSFYFSWEYQSVILIELMLWIFSLHCFKEKRFSQAGAALAFVASIRIVSLSLFLPFLLLKNQWNGHGRYFWGSAICVFILTQALNWIVFPEHMDAYYSALMGWIPQQKGILVWGALSEANISLMAALRSLFGVSTLSAILLGLSYLGLIFAAVTLQWRFMMLKKSSVWEQFHFSLLLLLLLWPRLEAGYLALALPSILILSESILNKQAQTRLFALVVLAPMILFVSRKALAPMQAPGVLEKFFIIAPTLSLLAAVVYIGCHCPQRSE